MRRHSPSNAPRFFLLARYKNLIKLTCKIVGSYTPIFTVYFITSHMFAIVFVASRCSCFQTNNDMSVNTDPVIIAPVPMFATRHSLAKDK